MGRCYEFGVSLKEGCEHAMVVAPEGGRCICPACGMSCPGQFKACALVVSKPGYVPVAAPTWALAGGSGHREPALPVRNPHLLDADPEPGSQQLQVVPAPTAGLAAVYEGELAEVRSLLETLLERPDRATDAVQMLNAAMASRDEELVDTFGRLTDAYNRLTDEVRADSAAREALVGAIDRLAERIADLEASRKPLSWLGRQAEKT
jgi:hypothetical protein